MRGGRCAREVRQIESVTLRACLHVFFFLLTDPGLGHVGEADAAGPQLALLAARLRRGRRDRPSAVAVINRGHRRGQHRVHYHANNTTLLETKCNWATTYYQPACELL